MHPTQLYRPPSVKEKPRMHAVARAAIGVGLVVAVTGTAANAIGPKTNHLPAGSAAAILQRGNPSSHNPISPATSPQLDLPSVGSAVSSISSLRAGNGSSYEPAVVLSGGHLALQQSGVTMPWNFTGINAFQLASNYSVNYGCGYGYWTPQSLNSFFAQTKPNELIRTWAFQYLATSRYTGKRDWTAMDQMVTAAYKAKAHLVLTLGNQEGTCDDYHWKDPSWYGVGYTQVFNSTGTSPSSYASWVSEVVARYAGNPAIAMWEPINEPQAAVCSVNSPTNGPGCYGHLSCPDEVGTKQTLINFFNTVGGMIRRMDPGKLISDGSLGGSQCGVANDVNFGQVISSSGIDVVGYHDYSGYTITPGDLPTRVREAAAAGKATMIGEAGIYGCMSATQEADIYRQKIAAALKLGVSGYLPWRYENDGGNPTCGDIINFNSPVMNVVNGAAGPA